MTNLSKPWDAAQVRRWLDRRIEAARADQAAADRRGYEARDDYDKAAAEEWSCRTLKIGDCANDQAAFVAHLKELLARDEFPATSIHDDVRFDRHVRTYLRKLARMAKAHAGFKKTLHHQ